MDTATPAISATELYALIGTPGQPVILDVRRGPRFAEAACIIPGAARVPPEAIEAWASAAPSAASVVVYCVAGHEVGAAAAVTLRAQGRNAVMLTGGIEAWQQAGLPTVSTKTPFGLPASEPSRWVTRARPKIDRIACPWLIKRFIDPRAAFHFVATETVFEFAAENGAIAFDIPGAPLEHDGQCCSFDAFLRAFELRDPALDRLALIVRGADTDRLDLAPQSAGLLAVSLGLSALYQDDRVMLEHGLLIYDALYAWCRNAQGERHGWNPAAMGARQ